MIENDPCERGLGPDGDPLRSSASSVKSAGASIGAAIRSRRFVGLYAGCLGWGAEDLGTV
jgi:MFS transporter, OFA family, oxalate/formate antiporter